MIKKKKELLFKMEKKVFDYEDLKLDGSEVYSLLEKMKTQETPADILKEDNILQKQMKL